MFNVEWGCVLGKMILTSMPAIALATTATGLQASHCYHCPAILLPYNCVVRIVSLGSYFYFKESVYHRNLNSLLTFPIPTPHNIMSYITPLLPTSTLCL